MRSLSPKRIGAGICSFARNEAGSATMWNVMWLSWFAIMGGLAIDSTNAWRHKTMLASTADVAALAGAWDLPEDFLQQPFSSGGYSEVETSALQFAEKNMEWGEYGSYMQSDDVYVGHWDKATRTFTWGENFATPDALPVNAVQVWLGQNDENANNVVTTLLKFIGIDRWEINTTATAMFGVPDCYTNGVISRETLFIRANPTILTDVCLHGQLGVNVRPNGLWANPYALSTGETPEGVVGDWDVGNDQRILNPDGTPGDYVDMSEPGATQNLYPPMVDQIVPIGYSMLAGLPNYRHFTYPATEPISGTAPPEVVLLPNNFSTVTGTTPPPEPDPGDGTWWWGGDVIQVASLDGFGSLIGLLALSQSGGTTDVTYHDTYTFYDASQHGNSDQFDWPANTDDINLTPATAFDTTSDGAPTTTTATLTERRIYFADKCHSNTLLLSGTIRDVTIVANCKIDIDGGAAIENVVLLTTDTGQQAIQISNGARIGAATTCGGWGGVRMYSNGDIRAHGNGNGASEDTSADSQFWGAQLVARDTIHFAAKSDSSKGISLLAGGTIDIAAQAELGALDASQLPPNPVGGCPSDGVTWAWNTFAYTVALVD